MKTLHAGPFENRDGARGVWTPERALLQVPGEAGVGQPPQALAAALDRRHPRDLLDVVQLCTDEGITAASLRAVMVSLVFHNPPVHDMLPPALRNAERDDRLSRLAGCRDPASLGTGLPESLPGVRWKLPKSTPLRRQSPKAFADRNEALERRLRLGMSP